MKWYRRRRLGAGMLVVGRVSVVHVPVDSQYLDLPTFCISTGCYSETFVTTLPGTPGSDKKSAKSLIAASEQKGVCPRAVEGVAGGVRCRARTSTASGVLAVRVTMG